MLKAMVKRKTLLLTMIPSSINILYPLLNPLALNKAREKKFPSSTWIMKSFPPHHFDQSIATIAVMPRYFQESLYNLILTMICGLSPNLSIFLSTRISWLLQDNKTSLVSVVRWWWTLSTNKKTEHNKPQLTHE